MFPVIRIVGLALVLGLVLITPSMGGEPTVAMPPKSSNAPDLQILVISGQPAADSMNFTYSDEVPQHQVEADLQSLAQNLNVDTSKSQVTNSALPLDTMQSPILTSVTLSARGLAPLDGISLPVAPLIVSLQKYHRLQITYIMPPDYIYNGIQQYKNKDVTITSSNSGSTWIFNVTVNRRSPFSLTLPSPSTIKSPSLANSSTQMHVQQRQNVLSIIVVTIVLVVAILLGFGAYSVTKHLQSKSK